MKDRKKLDVFLDTALWILGAGTAWSAVYFGLVAAQNTLMFVFPILTVTAVTASALFIAAFGLARGFPLKDANDRRPEGTDGERAFADRYQKRQKAARRLCLVSFGMLIPAVIDLLILYLS